MINHHAEGGAEGQGHPGAGEGEHPPGRPPHLRAGRRVLRLPYGMVLDEIADGDQVFEAEGVKVIVDP